MRAGGKALVVPAGIDWRERLVQNGPVLDIWVILEIDEHILRRLVGRSGPAVHLDQQRELFGLLKILRQADRISEWPIGGAVIGKIGELVPREGIDIRRMDRECPCETE